MGLLIEMRVHFYQSRLLSLQISTHVVIREPEKIYNKNMELRAGSHPPIAKLLTLTIG